MSDLITPDQIAQELRTLAAQADKGAETIRLHELRFYEAERHHQAAFDDGYKSSTGTIAEREIAGRGAAAALRVTLDKERADLNWAKNQARHFESRQSNLQSQLKAITVAMQS